MKIGIFGGSFNPVHNAHLIIAEYTREKYDLDKIIFVPVGVPSHRANNLLSGEERYKMLQLAIEDNSEFDVSDIEIKEKGKSYTIDTLRKMKNIYKEAEFYEIIGGDSADYIEEWKEWKEILKLSKVLVFNRKGYKEKEYKNLYYIDSPIIEISASECRKKIEEKKNLVKYYLNSKVYEYIIENKLYIGGN